MYICVNAQRGVCNTPCFHGTPHSEVPECETTCPNEVGAHCVEVICQG